MGYTYDVTHPAGAPALARSPPRGYTGDAASLGAAFADQLHCGSTKLRRTFVDVPAWAAEHIAVCASCSAARRLVAGCYGHSLTLIHERGWVPPFSCKPKQVGKPRNYPPARAFVEHVHAAIDKAAARGAVRQVPPDVPGVPSAIAVYSPLMVVIKPGDVRRARDVCGIELTDSAAVHAANAALRARCSTPADLADFKEIKVRTVIDFTGSGVNACLERMPHTMETVVSATMMMRRGGYFASLDLESAFHMLALAESVWPLMGFTTPDGRRWQHTTAAFGLAVSPALMNLVSAELVRFLRAHGCTVIAYVDDFLFYADTKAEVDAQLRKALELLARLRVPVNASKLTWGSQSIVFLGIRLDTTSMSASISADRARNLHADVAAFFDSVSRGNRLARARHGPHRSTLGKLSWAAPLTQSGRGRLREAWDYVVRCTPASQDLLDDLNWWSSTLQGWVEAAHKDGFMHFASRLVTPESLASARIVISDASATGYGYWSIDAVGPIAAIASAVAFTADQCALSSTAREALAVQDFMLHHAAAFAGRVLFFVTDNASLAYSLCSGVLSDRDIIRSIMDRADALRIRLFALFCPREFNTCADYLSRLCSATAPPLRSFDLALVEHRRPRGALGAPDRVASSGPA